MEDEVTVLDQTPPEREVPNFVKGDATALPFEDGSFDYVVSVDTYEHIPPEVRDEYLSELRRVAQNGVLLAAPFDSPAVRHAEQIANEFHRAVHNEENVWLQEHTENGLPSLDDTRRFFEGCGDSASVVPNGYIPHWIAMLCLTFYGPKLGDDLRAVFDRVNTFYNEFVYASDNAEPCYRYLIVSQKEATDADIAGIASSEPVFEKASHASALFGTLSAVLPLSTELKRINTSLARERALLARRAAQIEDLSRRLAERLGGENVTVSQSERRIAEVRRQQASAQRESDQLRGQLARVTGSRAWRLLTILHKLRLRLSRNDDPR
jgi:SAM-dependent methyltransferase